jgi:acetylornithine deacetylase/succinyl-diaminopimelate desuccinylase-like protein
MFTAGEIKKYVESNRERIINCLVEMIQVPSTTGEELEVSKIFSKWIESFGINIEIVGSSDDRPNIMAEWFGTQPGKRFIFNGHMDTFPPNADPGLYGPYSGKIVNGYIYGRGTCDMKSGDAAILMATGLLKEMGFDPKGSILLNFVCDEENQSYLGTRWLLEKGLLNGDYGICPEATGGRIRLGHSGTVHLAFTYSGQPAHALHHHPTMDALEKATKAISTLYNFRDTIINHKEDPHYGPPALSITTLHAGTVANVHADQATFTIDRRTLPSETNEQVIKEITDILDQLKVNDPGMDYEMKFIDDRPFLEVPEDSPAVQEAVKAYEEITGKPAILYRQFGGTDAAFFQQVTNIHMPVWGAALTEMDGDLEFGECTPNERISVDLYVESVAYYMLMVANLMR